MATETNVRNLQRMYLQAKLAAEKQKNDVVKKVKTGQGEFVLLDARDRPSYEKAHIPGAISMPLDEVDRLVGELEPSMEYVTYCWNHT